MVVDYAAEAASHGAVYLEGIFSPAERVRRGCTWEDIFEGVCNGAQEARELHGVEIRLTPDIPRGFTQEEARETVEWCARYLDRGVVGVGLGGLEAEFPPEPYEAVFKHAKTLGLGSVPHAGEVAGAASVRGALESLEADRLRHGIRAEEDPGLVREIAARGDRPRHLPALEPPHGRRRAPPRPPAAPARRRRRPLLDLDRRPGDVRHRPRARLRGGDLVRPGSALVLRRRALHGALCDAETRSRLQAIGDAYDWEQRRGQLDSSAHGDCTRSGAGRLAERGAGGGPRSRVICSASTGTCS